jgi:hypothetical protein
MKKVFTLWMFALVSARIFAQNLQFFEVNTTEGLVQVTAFYLGKNCGQMEMQWCLALFLLYGCLGNKEFLRLGITKESLKWNME